MDARQPHITPPPAHRYVRSKRRKEVSHEAARGYEAGRGRTGSLRRNRRLGDRPDGPGNPGTGPKAPCSRWGRRQARDRQQGQAAAYVSPLRCAPTAFINGGGCAASLVNQWKRLRRSTVIGGPVGRCQHGHPHAGCWCAPCVLTPMPTAEAGRLGAARSAGFAAFRHSLIDLPGLELE